MRKNATYKEKFSALNSWMPKIVNSIKKDLLNEHIKRDMMFVKEYFAGKNIAKLTAEDLASAYSHRLENGENSEDLGEFISNRWLLKHTDLYHFFETELSKISPTFQELDLLEKKDAIKLMEAAIAQFGAPKTYLFCMLNSVVFPEDVYADLSKKAEKSAKEQELEEAKQQETETFERSMRGYEDQIARLTDKYEKKIQGLQKKYTVDVEGLKKQLATLQRKLAGK
jgi:hypothetical protein